MDKTLYYYNQQSIGTLVVINTGKTNDFIHATAMVRVTLEGVDIYSDYEKVYRALCRKIGMCCLCYVLKMHLRERKGANCLNNLNRMCRGIHYRGNKQFTLENLRRHMPDATVCSPALKESYSIR